MEREKTYKELSELLTEIYKDFTSERRIKTLTDELYEVIEKTDMDLMEVDYYLDEFEGESSDVLRFRRILSFVVRSLDVGNDNARRLIRYLRSGRDETVYVLLRTVYDEFLSEEERKTLEEKASEYPTGFVFGCSRR